MNHKFGLYKTDTFDQSGSFRDFIPTMPSTSTENFKLRLGNEALNKDSDVLLHLGLGVQSHDLKAMFGDVEMVCFTTSPQYAESTAKTMAEAFGCDAKFYKLMLQNLSPISHVYALFKVGNVLTVSHGIGMASTSIVLHEISKLLCHAEVKNVIFLRLGSSMGFGLPLGTVVISDKVMGPDGKKFYDIVSLGLPSRFPAVVNEPLKMDLLNMQEPGDNFDIICGHTMTCNDFYAEQFYPDGALLTTSEDERFSYAKWLRESLGVMATDMESLVIAAFADKLGGVFGSIGVVLEDVVRKNVGENGDWRSWVDLPIIIACRFAQSSLMNRGKVANISGFPPCDRCIEILNQEKVSRPDPIGISSIESGMAAMSLNTDETYSCPHVIKSIAVLSEVEMRCMMYN